ncbi:hypothetical protein T10_4460 [Trichinella papuae]|uniref:Uncharacterized protein n=1 Tax=Trichinella papuae TaxID=268474 RepID=A0A0V1N398_9BILA|nr:hypothetical protein T10_4460 [Trichinella papuae]
MNEKRNKPHLGQSNNPRSMNIKQEDSADFLRHYFPDIRCPVADECDALCLIIMTNHLRIGCLCPKLLNLF